MSNETPSSIPHTPLTISYGQFQYETSLEFLIALALAVVVVSFFSMKKFGESTLTRSEDDLTTQLLPKHLATREQYTRAHMFYLTIMTFFVFGTSMLGPEIIGQVTGTSIPIVRAAFPLFVALALVGAVPLVPWLSALEEALRRKAHKMAFIPAAVQEDCRRLKLANFDFSQLRQHEVATSSAMRGIAVRDFDQPRGSIEYNWARLSCLAQRLSEVQDGSSGANFDSEVLQSYATDVKKIFSQSKALESEITEYRKKKCRNPRYDDSELKSEINAILCRIYVLLACGVRLQRRNGDIAAALYPFGFRLDEKPGPGNDNLIILACGIVVAAVLAFVQVTIWVGQLAKGFDLWAPSMVFPMERYEPILWAVSLSLVYGTAFVVADRTRRYRLSRGSWFAHAGSNQVRIYANYVRVAVFCAIAGYVVLFLWGAIFRGVSVEGAKEQIPFALIPALTGAFFVFYLDGVELGCAWPPKVAAAVQALCVGFFSYIAAGSWLSMFTQHMNTKGLLIDLPDAVNDLPIFVALLHGVIGACLALFVLKTATAHLVHIKFEAEGSAEIIPETLTSLTSGVIPIQSPRKHASGGLAIQKG
jgi:hypothetical protein